MQTLYHTLRSLVVRVIRFLTRRLSRSRRREKIRELYRFAAFGKLSAGLFHDLMNPLTAVNLAISDVAARARGKTKLSRSLSLALQASKRMERFISALRTQMKSGGVAKLFSLNTETEEVLALFQYQAREARVALHFHASREIFLTAHSFKWNQIVCNLVSNALEAYEGTRVTPRVVKITLEEEEGQILFAVADHGAGITPDVGERIFRPFFTTKVTGTGLGLSTSKDLVEKDFHGSIHYSSSPEHGTTFHVKIPVSP